MNPELIYLDYAATTPIDPRVADIVADVLSSSLYYANPASAHYLGQQAKERIEFARAQVADLINADAREIIWTSGATEANNLALKGASALYKGKGKHIITLKIEHPSVLETLQQLEKQGFLVTYLTPDEGGLIDLDEFYAALRPDTFLVSLAHVNNEIGVIQPIKKISEITAERNILFHVDAAQSAGKIPLDLSHVPIDLLSLSAHKLYGPKGIGALYVRGKPRVRVAALIHGGGQESGMRSGTLATHQIAGMGAAFNFAREDLSDNFKKIAQLKSLFLSHVLTIKDTLLNGSIGTDHYPGIVNIQFKNKSNRLIMQALPQVAISAGSACHAKGNEPSYVLRALGLSTEAAQSSLRFSFGRFTTWDEIESVSHLLKKSLVHTN